jgi:exosortase A-associated hydrolase 1
MGEIAICFDCAGETLVGVIHRPQEPGKRGVLVVVGGPQYRVGSHRQFVLLARDLARDGIPVLRFDHRGMGDSSGEAQSFEQINADIAAAIDTFFQKIPDLGEVVIWGLCDAASAAMFYAHTDPRVTGLVLLNPWARSEASLARTYLFDYYASRFISRDVWQRMLRGEFQFAKALRSFLSVLTTVSGLRRVAQKEVTRNTSTGSNSATGEAKQIGQPTDFRVRMCNGLQRFSGPVLLILSGNDLTASEFKGTVSGSRQWRKVLAREGVSRRELSDANHTFSQREWRDQVTEWTQEWVKSW